MTYETFPVRVRWCTACQTKCICIHKECEWWDVRNTFEIEAEDQESSQCKRDVYKGECCRVIDRAEEGRSNGCKANKIDGLPDKTRERNDPMKTITLTWPVASSGATCIGAVTVQFLSKAT